MKTKIVIPVIVGPTSSGKTSLSIEIAKKINGEIISADSRQVVKGMDIGTGKLPLNTTARFTKYEQFWEIADVKIWGYDLVNPDQYFSSYDFALYALEKFEHLCGQNKVPLLVGGTGFYVDTATGRSQASAAAPDFTLRNKLEALSLEQLQNQLLKVDPNTYKKIDLSNKVRLIRAIEKNLSPLKNDPLKVPEKYKFVYIGLTAPRQVLYERADRWVDEVWKNGLIKETQTLIEKGYAQSAALKGLIYKSAIDVLNGKTAEIAKQEAKFDIHAYIRRQQTWFKRNPDIRWFDITEKDFSKNALNYVQYVLEEQ
jgi:tRNA dimethylallyltransferase